MPESLVLDYEKVPVGGLTVHRSPGNLTIVLPASDLWARLGQAAALSALVMVVPCAVVMAGFVVVWVVRGVWPLDAIIPFCATFFVGGPLMVAYGAYCKQAVYVEATSDSVRLTLVGRGPIFASTWSRSDILAIDLKWHGVRLRLRGKRRPGWITFGNRSHHRRICQLLRDELNLPPRVE
jgi:hypothetical protein